MIKAIVIALSIVATAGAAQRPARPFTLGDLTVPHERLPAGCALSQAPSEHLAGTTVRGGLWAGLRIPTNPWAGVEAPIIADIRQRIDLPLTPDGPPLTERERARFRLRLAEGIEEGYAAVYRESESNRLVVVYGLRFASPEDAARFWSTARVSRNPRTVGAAIGSIVVVASGEDGHCLQAIGTYLKSLAHGKGMEDPSRGIELGRMLGGHGTLRSPGWCRPSSLCDVVRMWL